VPGNSLFGKGGQGWMGLTPPWKRGARVDRVNSPLEKVCQGAEALPLWTRGARGGWG